MIKKEEIIYDVIGNLKRLTASENATFQNVRESGYDFDVTIHGVTFACMVKTILNKANYNLIIQQMKEFETKTNKPLLIATRHIVPDLFDKYIEENISVVESTGNCAINATPLFIRINGQKAVQPKEAKGKAFNEAGLKLIFYFLQEEGNINKPYRKINEETGLSLGTIKNVIEELGKSMFIITTTKGRVLKNKKELLNIWQIHYNQTLKPKLLLKELEFVDNESRKGWNDMPLPEATCWGGEGGAYLLDGYLIPELFDIYTEMPSIKLVMNRKVKFQENGRIHLYQKFWKGGNNDKVAPKILVYADLMGSGNSRCIEAAQKLIENGI